MKVIFNKLNDWMTIILLTAITLSGLYILMLTK